MRFGTEKLVLRLELIGSGVSAAISRMPLSWHGVGALVVGVLLARWTWILFAPHSMAVFPAKSEANGNISETLFGKAVVSAITNVKADATLGNVHLVGVFTGKQGFAVLKMDEKTQRGIALGEEVIKGTRLVEVAADHVVLEHDGLRQRLDLETKAKNNIEGVTVEHPSYASGVNQVVADWGQARQEMQKKQKTIDAH